jgi:hypothetical protein
MKPLTYAEYIVQLQAACVAKGLPLDHVGTVSCGDYHRRTYPIYRVTIRRPLAGQPAVCWASGLHGDEAAGPWGVLEFLKGRYDPRAGGAECPVYPLVNPFGFDEERRLNAYGLDINRTFGVDDVPAQEARVLLGDMARRKFSLLHTLHEDSSRTGAYVYYSDDSRRWLAERMLTLAMARHAPINSNEYDLGGKVRLYKGLAPYNLGLYPALRSMCPLEDRWLQQGVHHFCTETPRQADLWTRVRCNTDWMRLVWAFA